MSANQKTETKSLQPDDLENKAVAAPAKADPNPSPKPDKGEAKKSRDENLVRFTVSHPIKKSSLLPLDGDDEGDPELTPGDEYKVPADIALSLARQGAGRIEAD